MCIKTAIDNSILNNLSLVLKEGTILLGVGNALRQDDGFGSCLARELKEKVSLKVWDAGSSPENFLGKVIKENPPVVLFIDAVDFGGYAGEIKLFSCEEVKTKNFYLTHDTSLTLLFEFLETNVKAKIYLLAVQPKAIGLGEEMSREMDERFRELKSWFLERFGSDRKKDN